MIITHKLPNTDQNIIWDEFPNEFVVSKTPY